MQYDPSWPMVLCFGDFELDEEQFELRCAGAKVPVQPKVLDVIFHLVRARERVVLKKELLDNIWPGIAVSDLLNCCVAIPPLGLQVSRAFGGA